MFVFSGLGSVGLSASMVAILPEQPDVPWWSWLVGAGGVGLAVYGIYIWQESEYTCLEYGKNNQCVRSSNVDTMTGPFLAMQSLPFLAVPTIYLIRHLAFGETDSRARADIELQAGLGSIALSGRF
jgi:hypothetical protein